MSRSSAISPLPGELRKTNKKPKIKEKIKIEIFLRVARTVEKATTDPGSQLGYAKEGLYVR